MSFLKFYTCVRLDLYGHQKVQKQRVSFTSTIIIHALPDSQESKTQVCDTTEGHSRSFWPTLTNILTFNAPLAQ